MSVSNNNCIAAGGLGGEDGMKTSLRPIEQQRAYEYVAEQIRRHIALRLFSPGTALPSERELVQIFGVGRPTVQLALRSLEAEGLITTKRGASGGTFVTIPVQEGIPTQDVAVRIFRKLDQIRELLLFRRILEPAVAGAAAEYRHDGDIEILTKIFNQIRTSRKEAKYMRFDTKFHIALAESTGSTSLVCAMEKIRIGLADVITLLPESDVWHDRINLEHKQILDAVKNNNREASVQAMSVHVEYSEQGIRSVLAAVQRTSFKNK